MQRLLAQDDAYWKQGAKTYWYKDSDRNTKLFHASSTFRRKINRILFLDDNHGNKITNSLGMQEVARNYFVEIFQNQGNVTHPVIDVVHQCISAHDSELLMAPFTKCKFRDAMFSMHPDKCPDPDGYNHGFNQHIWNLCSDDNFKECCTWLDRSFSSRFKYDKYCSHS